MLILAGVSINAIVGEDGIITKAKDATYLQSCAVLEEYLQEKYAEYYDESEKYSSKPELLNAKINNLLLKDGTRDYIVNEGKIYYLINKPSLPRDIQKSLVGGDTTEWANYIRLNDVYGVTEDLKVYYCNNETGTVFGDMTASDLDPNAPVTMINNDTGMKNAITSVLADIGITVDPETGVTNSDISKIKDLKLDGNGNASGVTSLESLSEIRNMQTLTLSNMKLSSLKGIESLTNLYYIYFKNCEIGDYSQLCNNWNLQYLYMYLPPDMTETVANAQVSNLGNGLANADNLSKLEYFGISGTVNWFEGSTSSNNNFECTQPEIYNHLTDISPLSKISDTLKQSIKNVILTNNSFANINALKNWNSIITINLSANMNLTILEPLNNKTNLQRINATYTGITSFGNLNGCTNLSSLAFQQCNYLKNLNGIENLRKIESIYGWLAANLEDISALTQIKSIKSVNFNGSKLNSVAALANLENLSSLWLKDVTTIPDLDMKEALANPTTHIAQNCGSNFACASKYLYLFTASATSLDLSYATLGKKLTNASPEFVDLKRRTNVTRLNLSGQDQLKDNDLQDTLKTMTGLQYLSLNGCSQLSSIDFIGEGKVTKLIELDLRSTNSSLTDLSNLNSYCSNLQTLILNNNATNMSLIQNTINQLGLASNSTLKDSWIGPNKYMARGLVLEGNLSLYNFDNCNQLNKMVSRGFSVTMNGSLDLSKTSIKSLDIGSAKGFYILPKGLTYLYVDGNNTFDGSACDTLEYFSSFTISNNEYSNSMKNLKSLNSLKNINIYRNGPTDFQFLYGQDANKNTNLPNLKTIIVSDNNNNYNNNITNLTGLEICTGLEELVFEWNNKVDDYSKIFMCYSLKNLKISDCPKFNNINSINNLTKLNNLTINKTSISNLRGIDKMSSINSLELTNNKISNIQQLSFLKNLNTLILYNNNISDITPLQGTIITSAEDATVGANGKITYTELNLSNNSITANQDNVNTLIALHKAGLQKVYLTGNPIINDSNYLTQIQNEFGAANVVIN